MTTPRHTDTSSDSRYLAQLQFDPALRKGLLNFFVTHTRVIILMIILLSGWGIAAYTLLPRESNPEVTIPIAVIYTAYPGASPSDVEELVTKKIENEVAALSGVDKVTSTSANSLSMIMVQFDAREDLTDAVRRVRDAVTAVAPDLPDDVLQPTVSEMSFDDQPIITMALSGPYDGLTLRDHAEKLRDALLTIDGIRDVRLSGGDLREIAVSYDMAALAHYGIDIETANAMIAAQNRAIPGGNFDRATFVYPVRSDGRITDVATLRALPIHTTATGAVITVSDVATVEERPATRTMLSRLSTNGSTPADAVTIDIIKKTGSSIITIAQQTQEKTADLLATFPSQMRTDVTVDLSEQIGKDFAQLGHDFLLTITLVMVTLLLIVGFKEALIAGLTIPLVFFATFGIMLTTGTSLNFLSLFSLLLALGLLVDDAIVVVSATKQYLRTGAFTPEEAVLLVLRDFKVVLLTTTLATTFAFLPLLLSSGMIGEFIKSIPITVSVTLLSSLIIALMINHPLAAALERMRFTAGVLWSFVIGCALSLVCALVFLHGIGQLLVTACATAGILFLLHFRFVRTTGKAILTQNAMLVAQERAYPEAIRQKLVAQSSADAHIIHRLLHGIVRFDPIIPHYERALRAILVTARRRRITLLATVGLFIVSLLLPITGIVRTEFFPASDETLLFVDITAPIGTLLTDTDTITKKVEDQLRTIPEIRTFSTVIGRHTASDNRPTSGSGTTTHFAGITARLTDQEDRNRTSYEIARVLRDTLSSIHDAEITVQSQQGGPPSGAAFEARISGDDLPTLHRIAHDFAQTLHAIPGIVSTDVSLKEAPAEYTFRMNPTQLSLHGLTATAVGAVVRTAVVGTEISTIIRDTDEIAIMAHIDARTIPDLTALQHLPLQTPRGTTITLGDVATIALTPSVNAIERIDQKRVVVLSGTIDHTTTSTAVLSAFREQIKNTPLPDGVHLSYGGENEENAKSVTSILRAMIIAAVLIVSTLVVQFNSFRKALLVLVTLPLALIGVFVGLAVFDVPLSFPGLIGILALFGIVVKNAIILVDKITLNLRVGIPFDDAVIDAGKSRLEAIMITSLCTILGIMPITLSNEMWRALGSAIIFGLTFSSFLTLFIIPLLFTMIARRHNDQ